MGSDEESRGEVLDYDGVLQYIGQFGRFQKMVFFLLWLTSAAGGLAVVVFSFTGESNCYLYQYTDSQVFIFQATSRTIAVGCRPVTDQ